MAAVLLAVAPGAAWAATDEPAVVLQGQDGGVGVTLQLPDGPADDTYALQLSLRVVVEGGSSADVNFDFAGGLGADVEQARYHADQNLLTLYLAGTSNLFANHVINLGSVVPVNPGPDGVRLAVSVVPSSLTVVNGAHSEAAPSFYASPDPAVITVGGDGTSPGTGNDTGNEGDTQTNTQTNINSGSDTGSDDDGAGSTPVLMATEDGDSLTTTGDATLAPVLVLGVAAIAGLTIALIAVRRCQRR